MALGLPWTGRDAHAETMNSARYRASLIALTRDRGEGSVSLDERADVRYRLDGDDARHLADGLSGAAQIAFAAGARSVSTLHADALTLDAQDATPAASTRSRRRCSNARERARPFSSFSAPDGNRAHGARHPPTARSTRKDGSTASKGCWSPTRRRFHRVGVNPMLTIMALAHRATSAFIARSAASSSSSRSSASPARSRS